MKGSRQSAVGSSLAHDLLGACVFRLLPTVDCRLPTIMLCIMLALSPGSFAAEGVEREDRWAILIVGVTGDADLQKRYLQEIVDLHATLAGPLALPKERIVVLFDDPSKEPDLIQYKSTMDNLRTAVRNLADRVKKDDRVFVFIEGHGNYDGKIYKLNLVGPDPTAEDLSEIFSILPARHFIMVNATNCSGGSLQALSREGRIVITATRSGMEKNQTHFGRFFVEAFQNNAADSDKNSRISIIEAFLFASRKVEDYYNNEGNLQTEHPVLDDNGDAQGQSKPSPENGDGLIARMTFLDSGIESGKREDLTAEQKEMALAAQEIEKQIEALKYTKGKIPEAEYERKLEELLLKLARINATLSK
ncbi:MAG: caspase family protein [Acidobacteria bacterium]|nr:caspase family protein [Acidobacteriota bacterium]